MQPSQDPLTRDISTTHQTSSKRKASADLNVRSRYSPLDAPSAKRLKSTPSCDDLSTRPAMSKTIGLSSLPEVIDLTPRISGFKPHTGVKRLTIKNLKTTASKDVERYYEKTWTDLDSALTAIFTQEQPKTPLEILCRGVEATCRRGGAGKLFKHLERRCDDYLRHDLVKQMKAQAQSDKVETLRVVVEHWNLWTGQLGLIRSIFSYLDRSYLLITRDLPQLEDMGIKQFSESVFLRGESISSLGSSAITGMCTLIQYSRSGSEEMFDSALLKASIAMLHILGLYGRYFEKKFYDVSKQFLSRCALDQSSAALPSYILFCEKLLHKEANRCDLYNLDASTKNKLLDAAYSILIDQRSEVLLDESSIFKLIETENSGSLKSLYELLSLSKIEKRLKGPWGLYIEKSGGAIVGDKDRGDAMILRLLELKRSLEVIIRDAFGKDESFTYSLREAFGHFINERKFTQAWGTGSNKVGEMIAKYVDMLLRGGLKAVPRSLISDSIDRAEAEKKGQASTGDEDAELDRQLERGLELFRFIEGKDVFEAFYKKDLARRLLLARSASQDAERNMLAKLRIECGNNFTHNLEQMFKDQELARDEMIAYKQSLSNTSKTTLDLQVSVLSSAAWPTYPDVHVNLPSEVARHIEKYDSHYKHKHTGRCLTWKHALAHSLVRANFRKGSKELLVSAFQAIVLVLFADLKPEDNLSYADMAKATGLVDVELERTLQSLACAKFRVLNKHPMGREVKHTDTFTVNMNFTDPKIRIKINQIQLKETKEENDQTHEKVAQDRQYETQAAIVRIMKSRKTMTHANLVSEVITQTKGRGAVEMSEIKKNIGKLIEKDYIERDGNSYTYQA